MRVLITGGTGFLGGHLAAKFRARKHRVTPVGKRHYDLVKQSAVRKMFKETKPEIVGGNG